MARELQTSDTSEPNIEPNPLDYFAVNPLTVGDIGRTVMWGFIFVRWLNDGKDRTHPIVVNYITVTPTLTGRPSLLRFSLLMANDGKCCAARVRKILLHNHIVYRAQIRRRVNPWCLKGTF